MLHEDVLYLVMEELGYTSRPSLLSAIRVCRKFYSIGTTFLYRLIDFSGRDRDHSHTILLQTLESNPVVCSYIHEVSIGRGGDHIAIDRLLNLLPDMISLRKFRYDPGNMDTMYNFRM
jgi:hypothetical protein